ncbi:hypothetical protein PsorP6_000355 [Peronosclerospora sorghi]|uniref:Uncharacterized protein n=1 Tax=Peronosclerospora sorghi TaxID=230839 RepID=A0ACC0WY19_9STRA|nr:hypothetical protein PsorP6_000355 [Peronosclerospora sorghi]
MKFPISATAVVSVMMARNAVADVENAGIGEGLPLTGEIMNTANTLLQGSGIASTDTVNQQSPASEDYFAPFGTDAPSQKLFERNGSLAELAPIINVAEEALHQPIPTNKWWGNLIHETPTNKSENYPAWAQPYSIKLPKVGPFGIQVCYPYTYREIAPEVNGTVRWYENGIHNDMTLSAQEFTMSKPSYEIYSWDDIGLKLRTCATCSGRCMDSALVNGMAFVSAKYDRLTPRIDTEHSILRIDNTTSGKFVIYLNNSQTWVLYADDQSISFRVKESVKFSANETGSSLVAEAEYSGTLRIAVLPENKDNTVYDQFASCIVRGGIVSMESRTGYSINWEAEGSSCESVGLLHFALPHQVESMTGYPTTATTSGAITLHSSSRGLMVGQLSTTWKFLEPEANFNIDFYPSRKPTPSVVQETNMFQTLQDDISANWTLDTNSWYFNGKLFQKYASLCLMAADSAVVGSNTSLLPYCLEKLEMLIEPLLNNTLGYPLVIDTLYRGLVTKQVFIDNYCFADFGHGCYNDHHYHNGYYVTAAAMIKFLHPKWPRMPELEYIIWLMLRDVANPSLADPYFPRFRHFSWFNGHSYSRGVTLLEQGKDEESTSEDVNFYFGMTMWGKVTGNKVVEDLGSLMLRLNAHSIRTYFLLLRDSVIHPPEIVRNHVTGIFFDNRVYYNTWFLDEVYAIHGIQMIPISPVNELARTPTFVEQEWNDILSKQPIITTKNSNISWLSVLLVNGAIVNPIDSLHRLQNATMDDGLTRKSFCYKMGHGDM